MFVDIFDMWCCGVVGKKSREPDEIFFIMECLAG